MIRATARLQFHKGFTLDDGTAVVPYLNHLGISHLYASPLLMARPGSTHGYDIVDHHRINPELGGMDALRRLVVALRAREMGLILDIVPNHMGVGGTDNAWWLDVLEWGRSSPYAPYFDIDWEPPDPALRGKLLAPFLGAPYGDVLASGDLRLRYDLEDGRLFVSAYDSHRFPLDPRTYQSALRGYLDVSAFDRITIGREARHRAEEAREALQAGVRENPGTMDAALGAFDPATDEGREALHKLLERQNYRLAWWRAAADEINWRRFFDINGLAGVRQEEPKVFDDTHSCVVALYAEGLIDGVRIDHVDGLADPRGYCRKLRRVLDAAREQRPAGLREDPSVIWIEKILAPHEHLPQGWLVDGTTGYDFMSDVSALLHDPNGEAPLTHLWTGETRRGDFGEEVRAARRQIVRETLFSELQATAAALHRIARRDTVTRDYTLTSIRRALEEVLVFFPVYRIYANLAGISEVDRRVLDWAMAGARRSIRSADRPVLDLIDNWLSGEGARATPPGPRRHERLRAMIRFQQLSAPTAAKAVEDTAFYRYGRLLSRNEVGADPSQFAESPAAFHADNRERRRHFPRALLATATHDHKRGEDTRVRIAVLSEIPEEWDAAVQRWTRLNASLRREVEGAAAPDAPDELMLYETLVGAWPLDLSPNDEARMNTFRERIAQWQQKAIREAKRRSGWAAPNEEYESACLAFLDGVLDPARPARVVNEICEFVKRIAVPGAVNSLSQTVLRLTCPGIPDLYQGTEFWDFSLVDPDNRRPVDYDARRVALDHTESPEHLLFRWHDGHVKQSLIYLTLNYRQRVPSLFANGGYTPVPIEGPMAEHAIAFLRSGEGRACLVVAARLAARLPLRDGLPAIDPAAWQETEAVLPRNFATHSWSDVLAGPRGLKPKLSGQRIALSGLLAALPVAILEGQ